MEVERRVEQKAAELAEQAVRGLPPFDRLPQYLLWNTRKRYLQKFTEEAKQKLLDAYVASAQFSVGGERYRNDELLRRVAEFEAPIGDDLRRSFTPVSSAHRLKRERFAMTERKKMVAAAMAERFPDYRLDDNALFKTIARAMVYSKPLLDGRKTLLAFDLGEGKTDGIFQSYICLNQPFYSARPASFFAWAIRGIYYAPEELQATLDETLELLEVLEPTFTEKMREAIHGADWSRPTSTDR